MKVLFVVWHDEGKHAVIAESTSRGRYKKPSSAALCLPSFFTIDTDFQCQILKFYLWSPVLHQSPQGGYSLQIIYVVLFLLILLDHQEASGHLKRSAMVICIKSTDQTVLIIVIIASRIVKSIFSSSYLPFILLIMVWAWVNGVTLVE